MYAAALRVELRIRGVRSLKGKRRIVKSMMADLSRAFPVSVAEVDHQDLWQRASIGIALVSSDAGHLERVLHSVERAVRARTDVEVLGTSVGHLEDPA